MNWEYYSTEEIAESMYKYLNTLTPSAREEFIHKLLVKICTYCGGNAPCSCWNDE